MKTIVFLWCHLIFTCIPTQEVGKMVKKCLLQDSTLSSRTNFTLGHIGVLLDICLMTIYFQYSEGFYRQT